MAPAKTAACTATEEKETLLGATSIGCLSPGIWSRNPGLSATKSAVGTMRVMAEGELMGFVCVE